MCGRIGRCRFHGAFALSFRPCRALGHSALCRALRAWYPRESLLGGCALCAGRMRGMGHRAIFFFSRLPVACRGAKGQPGDGGAAIPLRMFRQDFTREKGRSRGDGAPLRGQCRNRPLQHCARRIVDGRWRDFRSRRVYTPVLIRHQGRNFALCYGKRDCIPHRCDQRGRAVYPQCHPCARSARAGRSGAGRGGQYFPFFPSGAGG